MAEPTDEAAVPSYWDNLTANIHGTGDLVIELKYCKWAIHKDKIIGASAFFEKALSAGKWKEGRQSYIKLHDDDPIMFARCIEYLYKGYYHYAIPLQPRTQFVTRTSRVLCLNNLVTGTLATADDDDTNRVFDQVSHEWRIRREGGDTEQDSAKIADISADEDRMAGEIDLLMFQLADKYCMLSLQETAMFRFRGSVWDAAMRATPNPYAEYYSLMNRLYPDYEIQDSSIKEAFAYGIALCYTMIREMGDEAAIRLRRWLGTDRELCFMVMDSLADEKVNAEEQRFAIFEDTEDRGGCPSDIDEIPCYKHRPRA